MGHDDVTEGSKFKRSPLWRARDKNASDPPKCEPSEDLVGQSMKGPERLVPAKVQRPSANLLAQCTLRLCATYTACNPAFGYDGGSTRRALTDPSEGVSNGGRDNKNQELIMYVNDELGLHHCNTYQVLGILGSGTFGQVVKAVNKHSKDMVAVKVIKNHSAYFNQAKMEIFILRSLQEKYAKDERFRIVQLYDYFMHFDHLCLVFEMLHINLYELLRSNHYKGLSLTVIRVFLKQLLNALSILQEMHIIHCDLKPENILLYDQSSAAIKLIDFGSACFENQTVYTYIQSRYYRSPEVLCGYPYNSKIDMWSLGCILAELFLGLPLFPGVNDYNQIARIAEMCSYPPAIVLEGGKHSPKYFKRVPAEVPAEKPPEIKADTISAQVEAKALKQQENLKVTEPEESTPPPKSSRPFSFNSMLSLGSSSPTPKEKGKKKKGKEESNEPEMGVEMTTIASYEHLDKFDDPEALATQPSEEEKSAPQSRSTPCSKNSNFEPQGNNGIFPVVGEWQLKSEDEFCQDTGAPKVVWKRYFNYTQLEDLVMHVPYKDQADTEQEKFDRSMFADFLRGLLLTDFRERWTAEQALEHPFVVEEGRQLFAGPGRYHSDVVMVENRRVEKARQMAEMQRMQMQQHQHMQKTNTRSVPIPRQPGLGVPYPASWGSLIGTSPGYSSSPPNAASSGSFMQSSSQRHPLTSHLSTSPPSPYSRSNSSVMPNPMAADPSLDDLREHSPDFNLNDSFSLCGSYDPSATSGLAHHLAYAQMCGNWPPQSQGEAGPPPPHPPGPMQSHMGHSTSVSSSSGPIPVPRKSDAMPMPTIGLSFEQPPGQHLFPPSPIVQSPGSFYGAHMHAGAANQLLGMSPNFSGSPWDSYNMHHQKPLLPPGNQQRRNQKSLFAAQRERAMSWSAPKSSSLSQMMASRNSISNSNVAPGPNVNPKSTYGTGHKQALAGSPVDAGRPQGRNRRKCPQAQVNQGWMPQKHDSALPQQRPTQYPRPPMQDAPDASWDPFFNDSEL